MSDTSAASAQLIAEAEALAAKLLDPDPLAKTKSRPATPIARKKHADFLCELGCFDLADALYAAVISDHPNHRATLTARADLAERRQDKQALFERVRDMSHAFPNERGILRRLARAAIEVNELTAAYRALQTLSQMQDADVGLMHLVARSYRRQGLDHMAVAALRQIIEAQPRRRTAHIDLIASLQKLGDLEGAIRAGHSARVGFPKDARIGVAYARVLLASRKPKTAARALDILLDGEVSEPAQCMIWANALSASGELDRARQLLSQILVREPTYKPAWVKCIQFLIQAGDTEHALLVMENALTCLPRDPTLTRFKAALLQKAGEFSQAEDAFKMLLEKNPDDLETLKAYGRALSERGETKRAEQIYAGVAAKGGSDVNLVSVRVQKAVNAGDLRGALDLLGKRLLWTEGRQQNTVNTKAPFDASRLTLEVGEFDLWVKYLELAHQLSDKPRIAIAATVLGEKFDAAPINSLLKFARISNRLENKSLYADVLAALLAIDPLPHHVAFQILGWALQQLSFERATEVKERLANAVRASDRHTFLIQAVRMFEGPVAAFAKARELLAKTQTPKEAEQLASATVEAGKAKLAARYLRQCARRWPKVISLKQQLVHTLITAGETAQAIDTLAVAEDALTRDYFLRQTLLIAMLDGRYADATEAHQALLAESATYGSSRLCMRFALFEGDFERASQLLETLPQGTPGHKRVTFFGALLNELELYRKIASPDGPSIDDVSSFFQPALEVVRSWPLGTQSDADPVKEADTPPDLTRRVFQYWDAKTVPDSLQAVMASWTDMPGWSYQLYDRYSAKTWLRENFSKEFSRAFLMARHAAEQSDFLRLCVLAKEGGLYVDADDKRIGSVDRLLAGQDGAVLFSEDVGTLCNNVMYGPSGHPLFAMAAAMACRALLRRDNDSVWSKTGPGLMTRVAARFILKHGNNSEHKLTILPFSALTREIHPHMKIPYKLTEAYWNAETAGASSQFQTAWAGILDKAPA